MREYRAGTAFAARGGRTPANLGAALERSRLGFARVLIFTRWMHGSATLTRWLADQPVRRRGSLLAVARVADRRRATARADPPAAQLEQPAGGRNSTASRVLYTIDFPHATLGMASPSRSRRDVARIARWILREQLWSRENLQDFFEAVAAEVRGTRRRPATTPVACPVELEAVIRNPSARRKLGA